MIIALVNSKGGVGKSTIAGNLAAWLHEQGLQIVFADCDTQRLYAEWLAVVVPDLQVTRTRDRSLRPGRLETDVDSGVSVRQSKVRPNHRSCAHQFPMKHSSK